EGSTFWFTGHFAAAAEPMPTPYLPPASLRGRRVLAVDDNATNRKVLSSQLLLCGVQPAIAASAEEALVLMRQARRDGESFDAVLLDHLMPGCDGAELGRQ